MSARLWPRVYVDDPCTIGRRRFPRVRRFQTLREAERYAIRARHHGLEVRLVGGVRT